ncbi:MAG TPA: YhjD/YihY/BrkB family envelope integrity protein [Thermoanaerobaculia bacterium]|nr:YhjD/YihY/BrkB family envelope integrity protein [Thermoanaerobaculia bacterium]
MNRDSEEQEGLGTPEPGWGPRLRNARTWFWRSWTDEASAVYHRATHGQAQARARMIEIFLFIRELYREFWRAEVTSRAASLAYTTLLSLIPLIVAFSATLGRWFQTALPEFRARLDQFLNLILPYESSQFAHHINNFVERAGAASGLGAAIFLIVSFRLFMAVEGAVNQIWNVEAVRGYRPRLRAFTMIFFWGPVLIGLGFTILASVGHNSAVSSIVYNPILAAISPILVMFVAFTMLFWLVPATPVQLRAAAIGAGFSAVTFELVRVGFKFYASALFTGRLNVIYGTLGLFVLFLIALEMMWIVILMGVAVSRTYQNLQGILRATAQRLEERPGFDLYFAMRALIEVSRRFEIRDNAPSSYRLAEEFGATDEQMLSVLRRLEGAGLVKEIGGEWTGYVPGGDPDRISVEEVVQQMEGGIREIPPSAGEDPSRELVANVFNTIGTCTHEALGEMTVGRMVRHLYGPREPSRTIDYASSASTPSSDL